MQTSHKPYILLLEDSELDVLLATRALRKSFPGADIVHAEDGEAAWNFLQGKAALDGRHCDAKPALALLDIRVPKLNGLEILACIRQHEEFADLTTVIMSSSDDERDVAEARKWRADGYVRKVMDSSAFIDDLHKVIGEVVTDRKKPLKFSLWRTAGLRLAFA